jgi:predicted transcriptional regulator
MPSTTIKVPRELRDRLTARAEAQGTTLAGAIRNALEASDEEQFWAAIRAEHAALSAREREAYLRAGHVDTIANPADDVISERDEW